MQRWQRWPLQRRGIVSSGRSGVGRAGRRPGRTGRPRGPRGRGRLRTCGATALGTSLRTSEAPCPAGARREAALLTRVRGLWRQEALGRREGSGRGGHQSGRRPGRGGPSRARGRAACFPTCFLQLEGLLRGFRATGADTRASLRGEEC